jgi:hypothetical protein
MFLNPQVGSTLDNGAVVIASDTNGDYQYVLAVWAQASLGVEYVTWLIGVQGGTVLGHYFKDIFSAVEDYKERIKGK